MKHKMNWNFDEIESRAPWEREIYLNLYIEDLKKQEERMNESNWERPRKGPFLFVEATELGSVESLSLTKL